MDGWQPPRLEGPPPPPGTPVVLTKVWDDDFDGPVTGCDGVRLWRYDVDWSVDPPTRRAQRVRTLGALWLKFFAAAPELPIVLSGGGRDR